MTVITKLNLADSFIPTNKIRVHIKQIRPDNKENEKNEFKGMIESHLGGSNPKLSIAPKRYPDQPLATAEALIAYSKVRFQPTNHPTASPKDNVANV